MDACKRLSSVEDSAGLSRGEGNSDNRSRSRDRDPPDGDSENRSRDRDRSGAERGGGEGFHGDKAVLTDLLMRSLGCLASFR